jgi:hypothetical protein
MAAIMVLVLVIALAALFREVGCIKMAAAASAADTRISGQSDFLVGLSVLGGLLFLFFMAKIRSRHIIL